MTKLMASAFVSATLLAGASLAQAEMHGDMHPQVWADDQSVAGGTVTAEKVTADSNGWLVVHRTDESMKPGPVVGHAPLKEGENMDVTALLTEDVSAGDHLMLMVHSEEGGMETGVFEYTLGAKEDGPVKMDGKLVTDTITAQ
ncbi:MULTISPECIES: DUF7282 domain-containing protein [Chromohalobacter]|uniref:DUF7282 domain-containing protein n=2 Tax=Chromohalobacter israelensis TaxID=141390 RepID=Q1QYK6_CHRI1|nr:hypothetical protein [Chromohalobacter salexigens]ABE58452.1 hypothetical protein Csal_1096 [Chromohalobacter salexigens DSM 3043]MDO0944524.1 hypothetical protein [Chromohalobacter salexigens]PWW34619.1 hypothetical protein DFO74_11941 [Chromohalobacter salexigens]